MRILVTGGAGFIGSNLVHHLLHTHADTEADCCPDQDRYPQLDVLDDIEILNLDALTYAADLDHLEGIRDDPRHRFEETDIRDADAVDEVIEDFEPDAIINLAAESHVDRSIEDGSVFVETNVLGTQILLDAARRHDVDRFVQVSTDEVYGSIEQGSSTPEDPYDPSSPYSASKAGADLLALSHAETYDLPVIITRCTNNYGPRQHPEKLIPKMITLAEQGKELPIYGDGSNVRDWIYVKDHCEALDLVLRRGRAEQIYHVAGQNEVPNIELVRNLLERMNESEELLSFVEDRPGHDQRYSLDDQRTRKLGWQPRTTLDEGLEETIDWYTANGGA